MFKKSGWILSGIILGMALALFIQRSHTLTRMNDLKASLGQLKEKEVRLLEYQKLKKKDLYALQETLYDLQVRESLRKVSPSVSITSKGIQQISMIGNEKKASVTDFRKLSEADRKKALHQYVQKWSDFFFKSIIEKYDFKHKTPDEIWKIFKSVDFMTAMQKEGPEVMNTLSEILQGLCYRANDICDPQLAKDYLVTLPEYWEKMFSLVDLNATPEEKQDLLKVLGKYADTNQLAGLTTFERGRERASIKAEILEEIQRRYHDEALVKRLNFFLFVEQAIVNYGSSAVSPEPAQNQVTVEKFWKASFDLTPEQMAQTGNTAKEFVHQYADLVKTYSTARGEKGAEEHPIEYQKFQSELMNLHAQYEQRLAKELNLTEEQVKHAKNRSSWGVNLVF